ncbi:putative uncharacterized protein [Clostridium sp. CAG:433]|nr:putative uncharacterized protein [Clostridium sp. CAG:433]
MIYITGDTHRDFARLYNLNFTEDDILIILGDVGINYYLNEDDRKLKSRLNSLKIKLFCIQGNHEERPENIDTYKEVNMFNGKVFIEEDYPNLIFAKNGELYNINDKNILVIGGAYSIDKNYRIINNYPWFKNEQLSIDEMNNILDKYSGKYVDIILSHTCPLKYEPVEAFKLKLDQSKIDKTMEKFLDVVEEKIDYDKWYCGHYHIEKQVDKLEFMFGRIKKFNNGEFVPKFNRDGYEIVRDAFSSNEVFKEKVLCPVCSSSNIIIQKGDGFNIIGNDEIALICNNCKKVYGFNDVKYKDNCPREL